MCYSVTTRESIFLNRYSQCLPRSFDTDDTDQLLIENLHIHINNQMPNQMKELEKNIEVGKLCSEFLCI